MAKGNINVSVENIFPLIKKFLYSEHDIFIRELVSNAVDASQKIKTLSSIGEMKGDLGDMRIDILIDKDKKNSCHLKNINILYPKTVPLDFPFHSAAINIYVKLF